MSAGVFQKNVKNFIGNEVIAAEPVRHPRPDIRSARAAAPSQELQVTRLRHRRHEPVRDDGDDGAPRDRRAPQPSPAPKPSTARSRTALRHPGSARARSAVSVQRGHAGEQPGCEDQGRGDRRTALLRQTAASACYANYTIVDGDVAFDNARRSERQPVRPAGPERLGQRGAHVREVRLLRASRLQLARRVPVEHQRGRLQESDLRRGRTTSST